MNDTDTADRWEPWQPKLGERVRLRWSGECPHSGPDSPYFNGVAGKIIGIERTHADGHYYLVTFDEPVRIGERVKYGTRAAAIELEPERPVNWRDIVGVDGLDAN